MSITMNIYYSSKGNAAKDFAKEMLDTGIVAEIRSKKGNLRYEYFSPLDDENTILLIDEWENQEALDEHHASETMKKIMLLRKKYDLTMKAYRYLDDEQGITEEDKRFIREK